MTADRYVALLDVADKVTFEIQRRGKKLKVRSYLSELLVLANETGRRLSTILGLRYEDLKLERRANAPHGSITWRAELDEKGVEWSDVPITPAARAAVEAILRDRPGIGKAPLFAAPLDPTRPVDRHLADKWLCEAERKAGLAHLPGGAWPRSEGKRQQNSREHPTRT